MSQTRYEKHLMRQRGAGPRNITANFGFSFDFPASSTPQDNGTEVDPPAKRRKTDVGDIVAKQPSPVRPELPTIQSEPALPVALPGVLKTASKTTKRKAVKTPVVSTVNDDDSFVAIKKPRRTRPKKEEPKTMTEVIGSGPKVLDEEILPVKAKTKARMSTKKKIDEPTLAVAVADDRDADQAKLKATKSRQKKVVDRAAHTDNVDNGEEDGEFKPAKRKAASKQTKKALVHLALPPPPLAAKCGRRGGKAVVKLDDDKDPYDVLKSIIPQAHEPKEQPCPVRRPPLGETDANILRHSTSPKKGKKYPADDDFVPMPSKRKREVAAATQGKATKAAPKSRTMNNKIETAVNVRGDGNEHEILAVVKHEIDDLEDELSFGDKISTCNPRPIVSKPPDENVTPLSPPQAKDEPPKRKAKAQAESRNASTKPSTKRKKKKLKTTDSAPETCSSKSLLEPIPASTPRQGSTALPPTQKTAANDDGDDDDDDIDWLFATAPRERKRPAAKDLKKIVADGNSRKEAATAITTATTGKRKRKFMPDDDHDDDLDLDDLVTRIGFIAPAAKSRKVGK
ncbi:hypothetical protein LTR86_007762 [Recurvomyces mirabilis]|nr:hypothetical protein LTR86_007762 [Recurvomyces mirabilis]